MRISKQNAAIIVKELSATIDQKINIMDSDGIIIASSDENRIGQLHKAVKKMIDEQLLEIVVHNEHEYEGALAGTNIALEFNNQIVGAVGVTGPYQKVVKYGQIIKKMTEILMRDEYYKEQTDTVERIKNRYLSELLFSDSENLTKEFIEQGQTLGIDATLIRRVMAFSLQAKNKDSNLNDQQRVFDNTYTSIKTQILHEKTSFTLFSENILYAAVPVQNDRQMFVFAQSLKAEIEKRYPVIISIGIDTTPQDYRFIHQSCIKAEKAVKTCLRSPDKEPRLYNNINMEIFSGEIPIYVKQEYINHIFKNISQSEIRSWINLLESYYEFEASIIKTAEHLGIHKNTLQYKLKKLKEITGYDPRSIRFSSLFYNAIHFYRDINQ